MKTEDRKRSEATGRRAERWAALYLRCKGYRILAQRLKTPVGEIDLVVRRGNLIGFVEVKARPDLASALQAVTPTQRQRIERAAQWWLGQSANSGRAQDKDLRFDVVAIRPGRWPVHLVDAWRP